jgi:hypothetical protein
MRAGRSNVNDRIDTRAASRSNSVIPDALKHHRLSLVSNDEARRGEFDLAWHPIVRSFTLGRCFMNLVYERCAGLDCPQANGCRLCHHP